MIAIIVTHDSAADVGPCIRSLKGQRAMVIDNASRDETIAIVTSQLPQVDLVPLANNIGLAAAVNIGLSRAGRDDVLILNPDVVVGEGAIETLTSYLERQPAVGIVAPCLDYPDGSPQDSIRRFPTPLSMAARRTPLGKTRPGRRILRTHHHGDCDRRGPQPIDWALGAALLVRRAAIDEVGGMDPRFFLYAEDADWCFRMWKAGWHVHSCPDAAMTHVYARSSHRTFDLMNAATRHHWRSVVKLFIRHPTMLVRSARPAPSRRQANQWR